MRVRGGPTGEAGRRKDDVERGGAETRAKRGGPVRPERRRGIVSKKDWSRRHVISKLARLAPLRESAERRIRRKVTPAASPPEIFDHALVRRRLDRAWARGVEGGDFLLVRSAEELVDRLSLVKRRFGDAADLGTPGPHAAAALTASGQTDHVVRIAPTAQSLGAGAFEGRVGDMENLGLPEGAFDLAVSLLALQTVNDLPGTLVQIRRALKPDGLLMAALIGGDSLTELRQSFTIAESEILGGASPRVAPFVDVRALGALAQRAGFALPVVDLDRVRVRYSDIFSLIRDLRAFGATNALKARSLTPLRRDVLFRAAAVYAERFADPDGRLAATFDIVWLNAWAPHDSQPKPLKPGSATVRLADALKGRD